MAVIRPGSRALAAAATAVALLSLPLIAPAAQGMGVGREVVRHLAALVKDQGATQLLTSVSQGKGTPYGFYMGLGFEPTGEYAAWGEEVLVLTL